MSSEISMREAVDRYKKSKQYITRVGNQKGFIRKEGRIIKVDVKLADYHFKYNPNMSDLDRELLRQINIKTSTPHKHKKPEDIIKENKLIFKNKSEDIPKKTIKDIYEQELGDIDDSAISQQALIDLKLKIAKLEAIQIKTEEEKGRLIEKKPVQDKFFEISRKIRDNFS